MSFAMSRDRMVSTGERGGEPPERGKGATSGARRSADCERCGDRRDRMAAAACRLAQEIAGLGFDVPVSEIRRPSRAASRSCDARHVAMYLAHTTFQISLTRMALAFGRERTSIAHAVRRIEDWRDDEAFDRMLERLEGLAVAACHVIDTGLGADVAPEDRQ